MNGGRNSGRSARSRTVKCGVLGATGLLSLAAWVSACGSQDGTPAVTSTGKAPTSVADYVPLPRRVPFPARPELDRGPLEPAKRLSNLSLVFKLSAEQLRDREALKAAQLDPASPSYHQWLTPEDYAARFGAKPADIERAKAWLASEGLEVHDSSRLGSRVTFSGTVANVQRAFRAEMHRYEVEGKMHYAMAKSPEVPAALSDVVLDVVNTHDFYPRAMSHHAAVPATADSTGLKPDYTSGKETGFTPPDWANVYDVAAAYTGISGTPITGSGVTIAVVGIATVAQADVDKWRSTFGLPASTVTMTLVPNTGVSQGNNGSGFEANLDVEWTGGIAKNATINYVYTGADDGNVDDATYYIIENNLGSVLSESWGSCDLDYVLPEPTGYGYGVSDQNVVDVYGSAANLLGITYVAATGDSDATGCLGDGSTQGGLSAGTPAAYPGVTAVGGTQFATKSFTTGSDGYFTAYSAAETVWNESSKGTGTTPSPLGGNGGISAVFSRPSYQLNLTTCTVVGNLPVSGVNAANMRMIPDVSFTAAGCMNAIPLSNICTVDSASGDCSGTGTDPTIQWGCGTSYSTPAFAGVVALMNQVAGGRLGNINPLLYALNTGTPTDFHDVTTGNNEVTCTSGSADDPGCPAGGKYGYAAAKGYDCGVGLGSLDVTALLTSMSSLVPTTTTLATTATTTTEGTPLGLTATVALKTGASSSDTLAGGVVTFAFQSYNADGTKDINWGSWTLGTGTLTGSATSGTTELTIAIPPGVVNPAAQYVDVYAMYGGDAHHFPSLSASTTIHFGAINLALTPVSLSVANGGTVQFASTGGVQPVRWYLGTDTTCDTTTYVCSTVDETTGLFTGGPVVGSTEVLAMDSAGAYTMTTVTVGLADAGAPTDSGAPVDSSTGGDASGPPVDSGTGTDAGKPVLDSGSFDDAGTTPPPPGSDDAGTTTPPPGSDDAGTTTPPPGSDDAGTTAPPPSSSGCSCNAVGTSSSAPTGATPAALAGLLLDGSRHRRKRQR